MKRNFWLAALVGVALTGCVNEEVVSVENQKEQMTFASVMKTQSRANVLGEIDDTAYPTQEDFKVYSWRYQNNFAGWTSSSPTSYFSVDGDVARHGYSTTGESKYWTTDVVHYWPDAQYKLMFAAYSPADFKPKKANGTDADGKTIFADADDAIDVNATVSYNEKGLNITNFRVQEKSDLQYDLMYSDRNFDRTEANNGNSAVKLTFNHALASIVFSAQKATAIDYKIKDIKIGGSFVMNGNFSQGIVENTTGTYSETSVPTWTDADSKIVFDKQFDPEFPEFNVPSTNPAQFTKGTSALLMIPQTVPDDAYVIVSYTITNNGVEVPYTTPQIKLSEFEYTDEEDNNAKKTIEKWVAGKRYIYRISFGANTQIYFEPTVVDWIDHPTAVYTIG